MQNKILSVISLPIPSQWLFSEISPNSNVLLWKLHRFFLKNTPTWHELVLVNSHSCKVKYYAEGKYFYVFKIFGSSRLLKISRKEFYNKCDNANEYRTEQSCLIMNQLADKGLAPKCEYIGGCTMIVDHAGAQLTLEKANIRDCIINFFSQFKAWSLEHGLVIIDLNENNWCFKDGQLLLVDIDFEKTCRLQDVRTHPNVEKRIDVKTYSDDSSALAAFLKEEELILLKYLNLA